MTKTFCDRCKKEITKIEPVFHIEVSGQIKGDLCNDCFTAFGKFMDMEDILYHTNPVNHHGIERTTFGAK